MTGIPLSLTLLGMAAESVCRPDRQATVRIFCSIRSTVMWYIYSCSILSEKTLDFSLDNGFPELAALNLKSWPLGTDIIIISLAFHYYAALLPRAISLCAARYFPFLFLQQYLIIDTQQNRPEGFNENASTPRRRASPNSVREQPRLLTETRLMQEISVSQTFIITSSRRLQDLSIIASTKAHISMSITMLPARPLD